MGSNDFPKIAVVGASSMVGSRFCELFLNKQALITADLNGKNSIDITSISSVKNFFAIHDFNYIILFSAFTDVDAAEKQRENRGGPCWRINVEGVKNVVGECAKKGRKLIFISTDFVFDGQNGPYSEDDKTGGNLEKISWYGITKLVAENAVIKGLKNFLIVRIAYPYRAAFPAKEDFARQILRRYDEKNLYPMFVDQIFTPTFIDDLAPAIELLVKTSQAGIFHVSSPDPTTPYNFAHKLLQIFKKDTTDLKKGSLLRFLEDKSRTPRPLNSALKNGKITKLGFLPTNWENGINSIYSQMNAN